MAATENVPEVILLPPIGLSKILAYNLVLDIEISTVLDADNYGSAYSPSIYFYV